VHVAERGVDAALGGDRVASRGEELGNAGRVEASLGQAEGGTQTGAAGTDDERIVLMVLVQPKVNSLCLSDNTARIAAEATYDDGVFAADERRCLFRTKRPVGEDAGYRPKTQISTRSLSLHTAPEIGLNLPAGRVVEKARIGARESCRMDLGLAKTQNREP
jgi:hypothetical protein